MTETEMDIQENQLVALIAAILLQPHLTSLDGVEIGDRRKNRLGSAIANAEDIVAMVWHRQSQERILDKIQQLSEEEFEREFERRCQTEPPTPTVTAADATGLKN